MAERQNVARRENDSFPHSPCDSLLVPVMFFTGLSVTSIIYRQRKVPVGLLGTFSLQSALY